MASSKVQLPPDRCVVLLSERDNIASACVALDSGAQIVVAGQPLMLHDPVPVGHKLAIRAIRTGTQVVKYGVPIGSATRNIQAGEHVHTHNLKSDYLPTFTSKNRSEEPT